MSNRTHPGEWLKRTARSGNPWYEMYAAILFHAPPMARFAKKRRRLSESLPLRQGAFTENRKTALGDDEGGGNGVLAGVFVQVQDIGGAAEQVGRQIPGLIVDPA